MPDTPELLDLARRLVAAAAPGEHVEVFVARSASTTVRAYAGEVESLTSAETAGCGIRVVDDEGRLGFASAGTLDEVVLKETLEEARDNLAYAQPDEHLVLPEPDGRPRVELDLVRDELLRFPTQAKVDLAIELERRVRAADPRITGVRTATWSDSVGEQAIASTTGIASWGQAGRCSVSVTALASDRGETKIAGGFSMGRSPSEVDLDQAAGEAVGDALRMLGATKPRSARLTVVLAPDVTASLLGIVGSTLSGDAVLKGRSPFGERVGEQVAAPAVTLVDDPTDPASHGAWVDDDEGLASRRNVLIADGVLQGFLHDTRTGRRSGTGSTGSAVRGYGSTPAPGTRALTLVPGTASQEELLARVGDGVYVQSVSGLHSGVNPVSGDFSVGAEGLVVRDGALAEPFREATIASTLQRILQDVVAVGGDRRWFGGDAGVTLAVADVSLGGT